MTYSASYIASQVGGKIEGDPDRMASVLSAIDKAEVDSVTFCGSRKYLKYLDAAESRVVIISQDHHDAPNDCTTYVKVHDVYKAYATISELMAETQVESHVIADHVKISAKATIGTNVGVGEFSVIKSGAFIGDDVMIHEQVLIGEGVTIGKGTVVNAGVKILSDVKIGAHCIIYPNAVIGGDGFGHVLNPQGHIKIKHNGTVIIEDHVEIGANTVIDKAAIGATIIRQGVKLDNLIQIAHGADIGARSVMAAQSGVSGSTKLGEDCVVGGQVAISGHLEIADGSKIAGKSGVASSLKVPNRKWYGYPAITYMDYSRSYALFKRLPELLRRISLLEQKDKSK